MFKQKRQKNIDRSGQRRRRPLGFESLESRKVLAGNVQASMSFGDLLIVGDGESNQVQIRRSGVSSVVISPLDSTTTINGRQGPIALRGFRDSVTVRMGEGDDVVRLQGAFLAPFTVHGSLFVDLGGGADSLNMAYNNVYGPTSILAGAGRDTVQISRSNFFGRFVLNMGEGNDGAQITGSQFFHSATVNGGEGIDGFKRASNRFWSRLVVQSIEGTAPGGGPNAVGDTATVLEGGQTTINVASNDTVSEGTLLLNSIVITQQPTRGTVTVNNDGTVTYVHSGAELPNDAFRYTIKDSLGNTSNAALVTISVTPVNDSPTAGDDSATLAEGGSTTINLVSNDADPEGQLDLDSIVITESPVNGTLQVNADGTVEYTHDGSETTEDSFSYTILDAAGAVSNVATVAITVTPVNDAPVAEGNSVTLAEGAMAVVNVAANDSDVEGPLNLASIVITQGPANGSVVVNGDGTLTYTHNGSETTGDSFRYTIEDADGAVSNEAVVSVTVTPVNDAPAANDDSASVNVGQSVVIDLADNDSDPENDLDLASIVITQDPAHGTVTVNADGTVTYSHDGSAAASDSFSYTIMDAGGEVSNEAVVEITISQPPNASPTAGDDSAEVDQGDSVTIDLANNDSDPENDLDLTSIEIVQEPLHGFLDINGDGTVTYFNDGAEETEDSFTYIIRDGAGNASNEATVTITINPFTPPDNTPPEAFDDEVDIQENAVAPITGNVLDNDTDADGDTLFVSAVEGLEENVGQPVQGLYGTLTINADGTYTYDLDDDNPEVDALNNGDELFDDLVYFVSDGIDESIAFLTVRILGVTD